MKSSEAFGHCAPCVEATAQPYRKAVKPANCNNCKAYWTGREDAAQAVLHIIDEEHPRNIDWAPTRLEAMLIAAARGERPEA